MKSKSKEVKQTAQEKQLNLECNWQKLADMEASLRKIANTHIALPLAHENIEVLLKFTKQVIRAIEAVKSQEKHYREIQQNYNMIQSKLSNHQGIVNSIEQQHMQRYKSLSDQIKNSKEYYDKAKKNFQELEEQIKSQSQILKKQNEDLKFKIEVLNKQKTDLQFQLKQRQEQIQELKEYKQKFVDVTSSFTQSQPKGNKANLETILCSKLCQHITKYLSPVDITNLEVLNKQCRIYMKKSKSVQNSLNISIIKTKNKKINYYHRHIQYFQKFYHKIPQQILQTTFYKYEIVKQSIGTQILNVLNSSAMLFEGKFQDVDDEEFREKSEDSKEEAKQKGTMNAIIEKQIQNLRQFNNQNPKNVLQIDENIIRDYLEDYKNSKQKQWKQISSMYSKIKTTAQIYSIDVQSIGKFITNILINFSKVFVLSKNLYAEARNLQSLNTLILHELSGWDRIQIQKNSQIEDLKAQLQAEKKLKIFFTNESIKSEQRALAEENIKLGIQSKFNKQVEKLDSIFRQKEQLAFKLTECQQNLKNLKNDNREIRKAYQSGKQKYNKILQELSVVKQTILRMNIV